MTHDPGQAWTWRHTDVVGGAAALATVVGVAVLLVRGADLQLLFDAWLPHNAPLGAIGALSMAAALRRDPDNRCARILLASGVAAALHVATTALVRVLLVEGAPPGPVVAVGAVVPAEALPWVVRVPMWVNAWVWVVAVGLAMVGLAMAPAGRWPRPWLRWVEPVGLVGTGVFAAGWAWAVRPLGGTLVQLNAVHGVGAVGGILLGVGGALLAVTAAGAIGAVVLRLRPGGVDEARPSRLVAVAIVLFLVTMVALYPWPTVWAAASAASLCLLVVCIGVAIATEGMFDLEVALGRAVTASVMAAFVTIGHLAVTRGTGRLLGGDRSVLPGLAATAVVALAFHPVRLAVQRGVRRGILGVRATPAEVLSAMAARLAGATSTEEVLGEVADLLVAGTGAVRAEVRLAAVGARDDLRLTVAGGDAAAPPGPGHLHRAVVVHEGEALGEVVLVAARTEHLAAADLRLLQQVADTLGPVLRAASLTGQLRASIDDLRASRRRLMVAEDAVRRTVERDIHDGAQQLLLALRLKLALAATMAEGRSAGVGALLQEAADDTDAVVQELRRLARGIYPPLLHEEGLVAALRSHLRGVPLPADVVDDGPGRMDPTVEVALYFCCLEAVQNAVKHAAASRLEVHLWHEGAAVHLRVADDGRGIDPGEAVAGSGMANMRDRVEALGGTLRVGPSGAGGGTAVHATVPVPVPVVARTTHAT